MTLSATSGTARSPWPYALTVRLVFHGSPAEFDRLLGPTIAAADKIGARDCSLNGCSTNDLLELSYWDAQEFFEERAYPNRYQETSLFASENLGGLPGEIFDRLKAWPKNVSAARVTVYRVGGQVNKYKPADMAFVHRTYQWMVTTDLDWSNPDDPHSRGKPQMAARHDRRLLQDAGPARELSELSRPGAEKPYQGLLGDNYQRLLSDQE